MMICFTPRFLTPLLACLVCCCCCCVQAILGVDIVCQAKSGMGKTAVFVLATLHQLNPQAGEVSTADTRDESTP